MAQAYIKPFTIASDFSRQYAQEVAAAASMGLITTRNGDSSFGRKWRVTIAGLNFLE